MFNFGSHTARSGQEPHTPGGTEVASVDFGTLRRYHGLWEGICLTYGCRTVPLGTLCDTMRWAWFGPVCQKLGRFGDTKRYIVLVLLALFVAWTSSRLAFRCLPNMQPSWDLRRVVPDDRAAVLKATVEFAACKVGHALGPRRLSALTVGPVAPVVIAKKRAEVAKARPGENAPQATITCIEAAMRSSSYANGVMVEQRAKFQGLTAKLGPLDVADIVGTGLMGGGTREGQGCHRQDLSLAAWSGSPSLKMVVGWPHRIGVLAQVCRSASHGFAFEIEVVVGGTHLEFNFVRFSRNFDVHVNCHFGVHSLGGFDASCCVWLSV